MYVYKHFNHHRWSYIFYTGTKKKVIPETKKSRVGLEYQKPSSKWQQPTCSPTYCKFVRDNFSDWYVFIRTNRRLGKNGEKTKKAPVVGRRREHGLGRYLQGREGRARWSTSSNQRTRGGSHLDLDSLRLKTWSKSDFSIAEITGRTYLLRSIHIIIILK